jgi:4-amino-4-deoxy-L-arabinose transferase-like glycosyltransferase
VGLLAGVAASAKPTGLFFVGVPLGLLLLGLGRVREWPALVGVGAAVGVAVMLPWLWRNFDASGNPVFPFLASWFANESGGTGHWTAEQVARYAAAHRFDGGWVERLRLLVMPGTGGGWMAHRGMMHPQWGLLFPMVLLAGAVLLVRRGRDLLPFPLLLIGLGLAAQVVLWLSVTHLQSRFLLPLVVPGAVVLAAAVVSVGERVRRGAVVVGVLPLVVQGAYAVSVFMGEPAGAPGNPNHMLAAGATLRTGEFFKDASREQVIAAVSQGSPELFVNLGLPPKVRVMLLGDATPLYYTRAVVYRTTYDASPLSGMEPDEWSRVMLAMGVDAVVVNVAEVSRLEASGWNAPGITAERVVAWMRGHSVPLADPTRWEKFGVFVVRPVAGGVP